MRNLRISQSAYIRDLLEEEKINECNTFTIPMTAGSAIEMSELDNYDKTDLVTY